MCVYLYNRSIKCLAKNNGGIEKMKNMSIYTKAPQGALKEG